MVATHGKWLHENRQLPLLVNMGIITSSVIKALSRVFYVAPLNQCFPIYMSFGLARCTISNAIHRVLCTTRHKYIHKYRAFLEKGENVETRVVFSIFRAALYSDLNNGSPRYSLFLIPHAKKLPATDS